MSRHMLMLMKLRWLIIPTLKVNTGYRSNCYRGIKKKKQRERKKCVYSYTNYLSVKKTTLLLFNFEVYLSLEWTISKEHTNLIIFIRKKIVIPIKIFFQHLIKLSVTGIQPKYWKWGRKKNKLQMMGRE